MGIQLCALPEREGSASGCHGDNSPTAEEKRDNAALSCIEEAWTHGGGARLRGLLELLKLGVQPVFAGEEEARLGPSGCGEQWHFFPLRTTRSRPHAPSSHPPEGTTPCTRHHANQSLTLQPKRPNAVWLLGSSLGETTLLGVVMRSLRKSPGPARRPEGGSLGILPRVRRSGQGFGQVLWAQSLFVWPVRLHDAGF